MYRFECSQEQASAIEWHGHRYCFTDLLSRALVTIDTDDEYTDLKVCYAEFTEAEMWALCEAWRDDDNTLACGSRELVELCQKFVDSVV